MSYWSQLSLQASSSSLMEPLDQFHDFALVFLEFILLALTMATLLLITNKDSTGGILDHHLVESLWTIYPGLLLLLLGLPSLTLLYSMDSVHSPNLSLMVTGHQWYWSYAFPEISSSSWDSYMTTSVNAGHRLLDVDTRCVAPLGVMMRVLVSSTDVLHAWSLSSAAVKVDATPGRVNQLGALFNKSGVFFGQCSELCGPNHSFMPIVVETSPWSKFLKLV